MRWKRPVAAVALLLAVIVIVGWLAWQNRPAVHPDSLGVTLLVNHHPRVELTPGTPLYFEMSITSHPTSPATSLGSRWRPWHRLVRLEASGRAGMPWAVASAGPPRALTLVRTADGRPEIRTTTEPSAVVHLEQGRQVYTVTEVASPEAMKDIRPGAYRVRAVLETPSWILWGWRGRKVSSPVTIVVRDASKSGEKRAALEKERLARTADFEIAAGRFGEAEQTARQLLAIEPKQAHAHILLGDALVGLKRRDEALAAYRRAMVLLPPSYEEPTLLMDRIQRVVDGMRP
jgi:hypothetical protein